MRQGMPDRFVTGCGASILWRQWKRRNVTRSKTRVVRERRFPRKAAIVLRICEGIALGGAHSGTSEGQLQD